MEELDFLKLYVYFLFSPAVISFKLEPDQTTVLTFHMPGPIIFTIVEYYESFIPSKRRLYLLFG